MTESHPSNELFPAGERTSRPHAADGWSTTGRKAPGADFSQAEADRRAQGALKGYKGRHRA